MNGTFFDPLNTYFKSITGALKEDTKIRFRVKGNFGSVFFVFNKDGEKETFVEMSKKDGYFETSLSFKTGLYWYYFNVDGRFCGLYGSSQDKFQLSVFGKNYATPDWIKGGIIYQIFPDRFCRAGAIPKNSSRRIHKDIKDLPEYLPDKDGEIKNDDFFGGNLRGITEKLPYLKSLSVTAIYLNPIFKAYSNHRYDTGDYFCIDPLLGTEEDLKNLISSAENMGIKVILDGVFSHVGADSVYFNKYGNYDSVGAYQSKNSPYYDWFHFDDYPEVYKCWWGIKTLPAVNKDNESFTELICGKNGVVAKYLKTGVKGYRLDVVDELPSSFVKNIRKTAKGINKDAFIIGEVWEDASNKISYGKRREYFLGNELDSVMNYPLKNAVIEYVLSGRAEIISKTVREQIDHYPKAALDCMMNILSTHDTVRILSALSGIKKESMTKAEDAGLSLPQDLRDKAVFNLKCATLMQYTLYGVPSVYYGDEAGLEGFYDPLNRKYFPWDGADKEIYGWYEKLGRLRKSVSAFKKGKLKELYCRGGIYVYKRYDKFSDVVVALNLGEREVKFDFKGKMYEFTGERFYDGEFILPQKNFAVFLKTPLKTVDNGKTIC